MEAIEMPDGRASRLRTEEPRRPAFRSLAAAVVEFDLPDMVGTLQDEPAWRVEGHTAATVLKHSDLRVVVVALRAGAVIKEHRTDARISVQAVTGHARLRLRDRVLDLPAGRVAALDRGIPHDVEAIEDTALLLTLSWSTGRGR